MADISLPQPQSYARITVRTSPSLPVVYHNRVDIDDIRTKIASIRTSIPDAEIVAVEIITVSVDIEDVTWDYIGPEGTRCSECSHSWTEHDTLLPGAGKMLKPEYNPTGQVDLYQCIHYEGMGNWCGCENRSRQPVRGMKEAIEANRRRRNG